ncbi:MAG: DUF4411 family protein [Terriglobales bacterium]
MYLLDANILITAHNTYYPIDRVPEFWSWLQHQGAAGFVKIPIEIMEEVREGRHDDMLLSWVTNDANRRSLLLGEEVSLDLVRRVVTEGYARDLTDVQIEELGRDPFLVAYALAAAGRRCVVTTEVSKPAKTRQNRQLPDVCQTFGVACCGPFKLNIELGFNTAGFRV